jgi:hypothetical protein
MQRRAEPRVLRDHVEDGEEQREPEEPLASRARETDEEAESQPTVQPRAARAYAHRLAVNGEDARRRVMAQGEEHIVDQMCGPDGSARHATRPWEEEEQGRADAKQARVAHSG